MRRSDRLMSQEGTLRVLKEGEYGILSTVDAEMHPYGVPLSYVYVDNCICGNKNQN